jgi:predicted Zn-dependent protease
MKTLFLALIVGVLLSCSTTPTGRETLTMMPDSYMDNMGSQSFEEMKKQIPRETDPRTVAYVNCIANAVSREASGQAGVGEWEIVVFKSNEVNAFALPGGKIGVYTGLLAVAKTPSQLAAVLGHEVGHVIAKHSNARVSRTIITQGLVMSAGLLSKDNPNRNLILAGLGLGAQFGVLLPFDRGDESEADVIGLQLMSNAGFDPRESVELWKNMAAAGGGQPPEFMSTHPSHESRIRGLQSKMGDALGLYQGARARGKNPTCSRN